MIIMTGIDYKTAPLKVRESFSFLGDCLTKAYGQLRNTTGIEGAVIVSTCNRTELYLAAETELDAFGLLCALIKTDALDLPHYTKTGSDVTRHLCALAGGMISQILGEDQILAQVKDAITVSREHGASCNVLEVLFRESVTAAKRIKTEINLGTRNSSIAHRALEVIRAHGKIENVLVIGNGEIGRLTARVLTESGYSTAMTLRTYRHGETIVPPGVRTIPYDERYKKLCEYDALISATRSPHYTITADKLSELTGGLPVLWLDLAVPRDIDPKAAAKLPGAEFYNVDSLGAGAEYEDLAEKKGLAMRIIEEHTSDFEKWSSYRERLDGEYEKNEYFPLFISSKGKKALLVGGGKIAARRAESLSRFAFDITLIAPNALEEIKKMHERGRLTYIERGFLDTDLDGCYIVIAATDDRELNRRIGRLAAERGIFASVADNREECGFLFPALAYSGDIVAGLSSGGRSHSAVAKAAKRVREVL